MSSVDAPLTLSRDELGLPVSAADASRDFDQAPGSDSVRLLRPLTAPARETGYRIPLADVLEAPRRRRSSSRPPAPSAPERPTP
jgi:hypothetical protein